ncbi:MAG: TIGR01458 family HAD-type hydrolase, partial [Perlucidibaca sp.]
MPVKAVCLDIAGVLVDSGQLLPGAAEALHALTAAGLPWRLLTNTSRRPQAAILNELRGFGLPVHAEQLFAAPRVVADVVRARGLRPLLLVHPDIRGEFAGLDTSDANAVVLCDAAEGLDYRSLDRAFALLKEGAPLLAVGMNRYFQGRERLELDAGPFVKALEYAAGIEAEVIGKPGLV